MDFSERRIEYMRYRLRNRQFLMQDDESIYIPIDFDEKEIKAYYEYFLQTLNDDMQHTIIIRLLNLFAKTNEDLDKNLTSLIEHDNYKYGRILIKLLENFIEIVKQLSIDKQIKKNVNITYMHYRSHKSIPYEQNFKDNKIDNRAVKCDYSAVDCFLEYLAKEMITHDHKQKFIYREREKSPEIENRVFNLPQSDYSSEIIECNSSFNDAIVKKYVKNKHDDDEIATNYSYYDESDI